MPKTSLVKIIPKPKPKIPTWVNSLFWVGLVLFFGTMILFFTLRVQVSSLEKQKNNIKNQRAEIEVEAQELGEQEALALAEKVKHFFELFEEHKLTSQFFEFLRAICHQKVQFTNLDLSTKDYRISLLGKTENFQTLAEQLLILKENKNIQSLTVSNISLSQEGKVIFQLTFALTDTIFASLPQE